LHCRFGGFLTDEALEVLPELAEAILGAGLRRRSLKDVAATVGARDPWNLKQLTESINTYRIERVGADVLRRHKDAERVPAAVFLGLIKEPSLATAERRAELFTLWLRTDPRPVAPHMGNLCELPVLVWLLKDHVEAVFRLMVASHRKELEAFTDWFLSLALPHLERFTDKRPLCGYTECTLGAIYHGAWATLAKEVQDAAIANDVALTAEARLPMMHADRLPKQGGTDSELVEIDNLVFWRSLGNELVAAHSERAQLVHNVRVAIEAAKTWGEFCSLIPLEEYSDILDRMRYTDYEDGEPDRDTPFEGDLIPGFCEGDYPPWLQTKMGDLLPYAVLQKLGTRKDTFMNGTYWSIPVENADRFVAALRREGYEPVERPDMLFR
jgi:hypothetical protein